MAKLKVFSCYDVKAEVFGTPFMMAHAGQAVRAFKDLANDKQTTVGRHPQDFKLVQLGEWDDQDGEFVNQGPTVSLGFAADYVERES